MSKDKGFLDDLFSGVGKGGSGGGGGGSNWLDFSGLEKITNPSNGVKLGRAIGNTFREMKARGVYNDLVQRYGPDVAEAAANAVRAGRTPDGIIARAEQQQADRAAREEMLANPPPVHGSARWATNAELGKASRLKGREAFDNPGSILLGAVDDPDTGGVHFVHWDGDGHLVTLAPSRSGKSETTIVPNLLRYRGATIVHDPKGELYELTSKQRAKLGPVYRINPYNTGTHADKAQFPKHGFNPLTMVASYADARDLGGRLFPHDPKAPAFFIEDALTFITPLIWYLCTCLPERANLHTVCRYMASGPEYLRSELVPALMESGLPELEDGASSMLVKFGGGTGKGEIPTGLQTFFATINSKLAFWRDPELAQCTSRNDVDFRTLKAGSGVSGRTVTIYVTLPFKYMRTSTPFLRMLFSTALNAMEEGPLPPVPVLFLMDEFLTLGPFPEFESAIREVGGSGVRLWFFLQELGALQRNYPDFAWQAFFNTSVKQFFGINDHNMAELISRILSNKTVAYRATNEGANMSAQLGREHGSAGVNISSGESISLLGRPLMTPDELTELLSVWNPDSTRASIVQLNSPSRPFQATLSSYKRSKTCMDRHGPWLGATGSKGGYPS